MKLIDYIKLGFGFYIGYEIAHKLETPFCNIVKSKLKDINFDE